ncbi:MAG: four helix bundle protein [Nitrospirota bacterium]
MAYQELEETIHWLELFAECKLAPERQLVELQAHARQMVAMLISSAKTAKTAKP